MKDRCPRCKRGMDNIAMWGPVKIGDADPVHVCLACFEEAEYIDKVFAEACTRAKRKWLHDTSVKGTAIVVGAA